MNADRMELSAPWLASCSFRPTVKELLHRGVAFASRVRCRGRTTSRVLANHAGLVRAEQADAANLRSLGNGRGNT
jgi:hypothetical protein